MSTSEAKPVRAASEHYRLPPGPKAIATPRTPTDPDSVVVQGDLEAAVEEGRSTRIRVQETYTDPAGYVMQNGELTWKRTLGRPVNYVTLPAGWMLTSVNTPAAISLDPEGRVQLRFTNPRNDELHVIIKAKKRPQAAP